MTMCFTMQSISLLLLNARRNQASGSSGFIPFCIKYMLHILGYTHIHTVYIHIKYEATTAAVQLHCKKRFYKNTFRVLKKNDVQNCKNKDITDKINKINMFFCRIITENSSKFMVFALHLQLFYLHFTFFVWQPLLSVI